jgi:hypothetical protein
MCTRSVRHHCQIVPVTVQTTTLGYCSTISIWELPHYRTSSPESHLATLGRSQSHLSIARLLQTCLSMDKVNHYT